ncbi:MAG: DMT family transporter [Steroidobacteraceae bacterium]
MNHWIALFLTTLLWAATYHVGKFTVGVMAPLAVAIWRFLIASAVLVPWVAKREGIDWRGLGANLIPLLVMGVVGVMGFNVGMFEGLQSTSATNAALIMAFNPTMTMVLGALLGGERIKPLRWLGLLLGIAGVAVVVTHGSWRALLGLSFGRGDLLLIGASACWALYSVIPKRFISGLSPLQVTMGSVLIGVIAMLVYSYQMVGAHLHLPPWRAWWALLFMGVGASAVAYIWWNQGVMRVGAPRAAMFMNLVPILTVAIAVALGQHLVTAQMAGAALVIGGVLIAAR